MLIGSNFLKGFRKEYNVWDKAVAIISPICIFLSKNICYIDRVICHSQSDHTQTQESVSLLFERTNELNGSGGRDAGDQTDRCSD